MIQQNKDVRIILNPAADNGRGIMQKEPILKLAEPYGRIDFVISQSGEHARQLAREAAESGYALVIAAGGDGSVHHVVNGIMAVPHAETMIGVIPIGSGNDFAYVNDIPMNVAEATTRLFQGKPRWLDLAKIEDGNGRFVYMDNNFGIGFDAMVVAQAEKITRVRGFPKYILAVFRALAFHFEPTRLQIQFDDDVVLQKALFVYAAVGTRGGGGFLLTPDAKQDDNLVDSCLAHDISRRILISLFGKAVKGTHIHSEHCVMRQNRQITIQIKDPAPMYVDGEMFAYPEDFIRQITLTSVPKAIQLLA